MSTSLNLAWYADRKHLPLASLGEVQPGDLAEAVCKSGADYFGYTERQSTYSHPQLRYLLTPEDSLVPPGWELIYFSDDPSPVVIYSVHCP
jgi:hypothetical protein